jgi:hypothetical protein
MHRSPALLLCVFLGLQTFPAAAQKTQVSRPPQAAKADTELALRLGLGLDIPLLDSAELFALGPTGSLSVEWNSPGGMPFYLIGDLGYGYSPLLSEQTVSVLRAGAGIGFGLPVLPWLYARAYAVGGFYYGLLNVPGSSAGGGDPYATGGVDVSVAVTSLLSFELGAAWQELFMFSHSLDVFLGTSFHLGAGNKTPIIKPARSPVIERPKAEAIDFKKVGFQTVFPVFYSYYDDHPVGTLVIGNKQMGPITDVRVSLYVKQYMDSPKTCATIEGLKPGESSSVNLYALFTDKVLSITQGTKAAVDLMVNYTCDGSPQQDVRTETISLYDRNAMTWDDDRRAAAFMTLKDPQVLTFSKNIVSMLRDKEGRFISNNLLRAMGMHEALTAYGISYVVDPTSPFSGAKKGKDDPDFLQFPIQTLEYKAGDCDDLTILYCALFESIGIPTAFITVPGHIYMAIKLEMPVDEAQRTFLHPEDLIIQGDGVWLPIEITEITGGFVKAWETGAKEWRENAERGTANFYVTQEAWQSYAVAGLPATGFVVAVPPPAAVMASIGKETGRFIVKEVDPRVAALQAALKKSPEDPKILNQIGILYGRYGVLDKAEEYCLRAIKSQEYVPSLVNLGNLSYLNKDMARSFTYFGRALKAAPKNVKALQGYIIAGYELQKYEQVNTAYGTLKAVSPESAAQMAHVETVQASDTARASEAGSEAKGVSLWTE